MGSRGQRTEDRGQKTNGPQQSALIVGGRCCFLSFVLCLLSSVLWQTMTPMMQQYREAKARHPGMLLLFRMGDFYELFDDDAEVASRVLGLTLTSRDKTVPMAGFPHHALETHLRT